MVHDITTGVLPADFAACDVLYVDLPWPNGLATFNERAAVDHTFAEVMAGVSAVVEGDSRPVFVVTGKQGAKKLPTPDLSAPIRLNQWAAVVAAYHTTDMPQGCGTDIEFIGQLARRYARVGDFCCGYGRSLRLFARQGKAFTGSDYNPHCIGYIAEHAPEWVSGVG